MTRLFHRLFLWKWISCQALTSVLCLLFRPKTVHCSTKNAYTSEITFLALVPWDFLFKICSIVWPFKLLSKHWWTINKNYFSPWKLVYKNYAQGYCSNRDSHKVWDFKDDFTELIKSLSLYLWFPACSCKLPSFCDNKIILSYRRQKARFEIIKFKELQVVIKVSAFGSNPGVS